MNNVKNSWSQKAIIKFISENRKNYNSLYIGEKILLDQYFKKNYSVLDIGCAQGGFINILKKINKKNYLTYGFDKNSNYQILNPRFELTFSKFDLKISNHGTKKIIIKNIVLTLIGKHNVLNASGAIAVCLNLGISINTIKKALRNFSGVERRLTKVFKKNRNEFFDDYAHHPTEIQSVLEGLRKVYKDRKIISVFQPHRYSRIKNLKKEFSSCFSIADVVLLCPVYAAGEKKDNNFKFDHFANLISENSKVQVIKINDKVDLTYYFKKNLIDNEIIIGMGAGSISKWIYDLENTI